MKILHMMVGLPRSGKSTEARRLNHPIVEPDAIRQAIHGTMWRAESETLVWGVASVMVRALFLTGYDDVTLDATNHTKQRRQIWESPDWLVKYHVINTPPEICIQRAKDTSQEYLLPIIERMMTQFELPGNAPDC